MVDVIQERCYNIQNQQNVVKFRRNFLSFNWIRYRKKLGTVELAHHFSCNHFLFQAVVKCSVSIHFQVVLDTDD